MQGLNDIGVALVTSIIVATLYGVIFSLEYPLVKIDAGLVSLFSVAGLFTYILIRAALSMFRK
jgi:hypothetical protein